MGNHHYICTLRRRRHVRTRCGECGDSGGRHPRNGEALSSSQAAAPLPVGAGLREHSGADRSDASGVGCKRRTPARDGVRGVAATPSGPTLNSHDARGREPSAERFTRGAGPTQRLTPFCHASCPPRPRSHTSSPQGRSRAWGGLQGPAPHPGSLGLGQIRETASCIRPPLCEMGTMTEPALAGVVSNERRLSVSGLRAGPGAGTFSVNCHLTHSSPLMEHLLCARHYLSS